MIPVFNGAGTLAAALRSVRDQTRAVSEIIVVDDASTDDSASIAAAEGARVLRLPQNAGPAVARNEGIAASSGDLVAFLDADDTWMATHCATLVAHLEQHPEVVVATSKYEYTESHIPTGGPFAPLEYLIDRNFIPQSAAVVRRSALVEARGYRSTLRFAEDYDLWLRLALRGAFLVVPEVTVKRTKHAGQVTWGKEWRLYRGSWQARAAAVRTVTAEEGMGLHQSALAPLLLRALARDFREAWHHEDPRNFVELFTAAEGVEGSRNLVMQWRLKRALLWPVRNTVRNMLRPLYGRLFQRDWLATR